MKAIAAFVALLGAASAQKTFPLTFTGNAEVDFPQQLPAASNFAARRYPIIVENDAGFLDVGTPPGWPFAQSGWDMKDLRFTYDYVLDTFHMAINCYGVCGDADGDGNPGVSSSVLTQRGGQDLSNFGSSESCAIAFDVGNPTSGVSEPDTQFDFVVGYPAQLGAGSEAFPCQASNPTVQFTTACFGLYRFAQGGGVEHLGQRFVYTASDPLLQQAFGFAVDRNPTTSTTRPDLEWSVNTFNTLRTLAGVPKIDVTGTRTFAMNVAAFCGSFQDDGVGEDTFPNDGDFRRINWPCFVFDACDVCGGDGSSCRDCAGIPNGSGRYDICDVCNGAGGRDCAGVACGTSRLDVCNVCNGNGQSCRDCAGVPFGTQRYDACDVCGGNGLSCRDCRNIPFGTSSYDVCDVCNGDGFSCRDCVGVPFGTSEYDICDVCAGDGRSCLVVPEPRNPCTPRDVHVCQFAPGDTFEAELNTVAAVADELSGADVTFCFAELGFVAVASSEGSLFQRFSLQKDGAVIIDDFASAPGEFTCPQASTAGRYTLQWDEKCSTVTLTRAGDNCALRGNLYNGVTLHRRECRNKRQKVYEVESRTQWTALDENGDRVWLNFCKEHAFIETRGPWADANTIFGWASFAQGVLSVTELGSYPRTTTTNDTRGAACVGELADYDVIYDYLPDSSDRYWKHRQGHTSVSSVHGDDDDDSSYGQYREKISSQAYVSDEDGQARHHRHHRHHKSSSSSSSSSTSSTSSTSTLNFDDIELPSTTSSSSSSSSSDSSSSSSSSSDSYSESELWVRRKRNNIQEYRHGRGVATLKEARIYGRIKDTCAERSKLYTGLEIYEIDMCNGELPHECYPAKPPCDTSSETIDGTSSPTSSSSSWCTDVVTDKVGRSSSSSRTSTTSTSTTTTSSSTSSSSSSSSSHHHRRHHNDDDDDDDASNYHSDQEETDSKDVFAENLAKFLAKQAKHNERSSSSSDSHDSTSERI